MEIRGLIVWDIVIVLFEFSGGILGAALASVFLGQVAHFDRSSSSARTIIPFILFNQINNIKIIIKPVSISTEALTKTPMLVTLCDDLSHIQNTQSDVVHYSINNTFSTYVYILITSLFIFHQYHHLPVYHSSHT